VLVPRATVGVVSDAIENVDITETLEEEALPELSFDFDFGEEELAGMT